MTKPFNINQIRAAGTPEPGRRQEKKLTAAQLEKRTKYDQLLERVIKIEEFLGKIGQAITEHQKQLQVAGLERHVALTILEQQVGREVIETLMSERAEHFGLKVTKEQQKVEGEQNDSDEPSEGSVNIP